MPRTWTYRRDYMIEIVGWIGSIFLSVCGAPQAYESYRTKSSAGISHMFLWLWFIGEVTTLTYIIAQLGFNPILLINYTLNIIFIVVIMYYKYRKNA